MAPLSDLARQGAPTLGCSPLRRPARHPARAGAGALRDGDGGPRHRDPRPGDAGGVPRPVHGVVAHAGAPAHMPAVRAVAAPGFRPAARRRSGAFDRFARSAPNVSGAPILHAALAVFHQGWTGCRPAARGTRAGRAAGSGGRSAGNAPDQQQEAQADRRRHERAAEGEIRFHLGRPPRARNYGRGERRDAAKVTAGALPSPRPARRVGRRGTGHQAKAPAFPLSRTAGGRPPARRQSAPRPAPRHVLTPFRGPRPGRPAAAAFLARPVSSPQPSLRPSPRPAKPRSSPSPAYAPGRYRRRARPPRSRRGRPAG